MKQIKHTTLLATLFIILLSSCSTSKFSIKKPVTVSPFYHESSEGQRELILTDHNGNILFLNEEKLEGAELLMGYNQMLEITKQNKTDQYKVIKKIETSIDTMTCVINDIWVLKKIEGEMIDKNAPTLTIDLREKRAYGHSGCNRYHTSISLFENQSLKFGMIASTKMYCPNIDIENSFLNALQKCDHYNIKDGHLHLMQGGKTLLTFLKVD